MISLSFKSVFVMAVLAVSSAAGQRDGPDSSDLYPDDFFGQRVHLLRNKPWLWGLPGRTVISFNGPKDARVAFEKGDKATEKRKWVEARSQLEKAVGIYPQYVEAWCALGDVYREQNEPEQARKAFKEAVFIAPEFATPYFGLAELSMHDQNWQEMAENTRVLLKLNNSAGAYAYDALANLNLNHLDAAEKSAREGIRIDRYRAVPQNLHLLGVILMRKGDYVGARVYLKKYLKVARGAPEKAIVRKEIAACEAKHAAQPRDAKQ